MQNAAPQRAANLAAAPKSLRPENPTEMNAPSMRARATRGSSLIIRNVVVDGRRTSIRLEPEMWRSLQDICKRERCTVHDIATMVAALRGIGSLTAALRVFLVVYFREAATTEGHNAAGHGSGRVLDPLYRYLASKEKPAKRDWLG